MRASRLSLALAVIAMAVFALAGCDTTEPPSPDPEPVCEMTPLPETSGPLSEAPGRLLITSRRDGTSRLYSARPDGSDLRAVTPPGLNAYEGAWSPDAQRVVFTSDSLGSSAGNVLYVMNADGSGAPEALRVTPGNGAGYFTDLVTGDFPAWSPDGRQIAFSECLSCEVIGRNSELFVYNLDTEHVTRLTNHPGSDRLPTWNPSGDSIAFRSDRVGATESSVLDPNLYVLSLANPSPQEALTTDGTASGVPLWNPQSDLIAYSIENTTPSLFDLSCSESFEHTIIEYGNTKWVMGWSPNSEWTLHLGRLRSSSGSAIQRLYAVSSENDSATQLFADDVTIDWADWSRR